MGERAADTKECPWCAETILAAARKCKHCGEFLEDETPEELEAEGDVADPVVDEAPPEQLAAPKWNPTAAPTRPRPPSSKKVNVHVSTFAKDGALACPRCKGTSFKAKRSAKGKLGFGLLAPKSRVKCETCGVEYLRG